MRQGKFLAIVLAVVATAGAALAFLPRRPYFDEVWLDRIRESMTESEVEAFLSIPEDHYRPRVRRVHAANDFTVMLVKESGWFCLKDRAGSVPSLSQEKPRVRNWWVDNYLISVAFDRQGRVVGHALWELIYPASSSLLESSESWFGL
jgi:hypothetical protein